MEIKKKNHRSLAITRMALAGIINAVVVVLLAYVCSEIDMILSTVCAGLWGITFIFLLAAVITNLTDLGGEKR